MWLSVILSLISLQIYIADAYAIHWVPPEPEVWSALNTTKAAKRYWELEWSKSTFFKECSGHLLKIVPVYFWPGERIDLPCKMCELSMAYNGKVKYWAKVEHMDEFLRAAQINVISRPELYQIVKNERYLENPQLYRNHEPPREKETSFNMVKFGSYMYKPLELPRPVYLQKDGKLSIIRANPSSQGVYFCYDELSLGNTNLFFIVLAMTPPISIYDYQKLYGKRARFYGDSCDSGKHMHIEPSFNWRFRFQPTFRDEKPNHCTNGTYCADYTEMPHTSFSKNCSLDWCSVNIPPIDLPTTLFDPGLSIQLRWDEWSSCDGNVPAQRREAHCYVIARREFTLDENAEDTASQVDEFKWVVKLGRLVRSEALRKTGVRLHSSIVASYLYRTDVIRGCGGITEGIRIAIREIELRK